MPSVSKLFTSCFSFISRPRSSGKVWSVDRAVPNRRAKTEAFPDSGINWIKAKIQSLRESRKKETEFDRQLNSWEQDAARKKEAEFNRELNNWEQDTAPTHLRRDYQKIAKKIRKCYKQKTDTLVINDSEISSLPPIPDHVTNLKIENLRRLIELSDLPNRLESLEIFNCPALCSLPSSLPEQLKLLEISYCPSITKLTSLPPKLSRLKLVLRNIPHANLAEIILQLPWYAIPLNIYVDDDGRKLLDNLLGSEISKRPTYEGPHIDFYNSKNLKYLYTVTQEGRTHYEYSGGLMNHLNKSMRDLQPQTLGTVMPCCFIYLPPRSA